MLFPEQLELELTAKPLTKMYQHRENSSLRKEVLDIYKRIKSPRATRICYAIQI